MTKQVVRKEKIQEVQGRYSVVAIYSDGTRKLIGSGLSSEEAERMLNA